MSRVYLIRIGESWFTADEDGVIQEGSLSGCQLDVEALQEAAGANILTFLRKIGATIAKGATAGARGVAKGATVGARGVAKGATVGARGVAKGVAAGARGVAKGATGVYGGLKKAGAGIAKGATAGARGAYGGVQRAGLSVGNLTRKPLYAMLRNPRKVGYGIMGTGLAGAGAGTAALLKKIRKKKGEK